MNETTPKAKIFFGNVAGTKADQVFGEWIEDHPSVKILQFKYQQGRYGDHSIAILYEEKDNEPPRATNPQADAMYTENSY